MVIAKFIGLARSAFGRPLAGARRRRMPAMISGEALEPRTLLVVPPGAPDLTFGVDGLADITPPELSQDSDPIDMAVGPDGTIYTLTDFYDAGNGATYITALRPDGTPRSSFGNGGFLNLASRGFTDYFRADSLAVQPDGRIVIGGADGFSYSYGGPDESGDFMFTRLLPDGSTDSTFGTGGIAVYDVNHNDYGLRDIVIRPDGRILALGTTQFLGDNGTNPVKGIEYLALMQLNASGAPDENFGDGGRLGGTDGGLTLSGFNTRAKVLLLDGDNARIVVVSEQDVVGWPNYLEFDGEQQIAVHQFLSDGKPDNPFGGAAHVEVGNFNTQDYVESATLSGGWIYVAGYWTDADFNSADVVARVSRGAGSLPGTGIWDTGFGDSGLLSVPQINLSILDAPNGGFFLAGDPGPLNEGDAGGSYALAQYGITGSLITDFGNNGYTQIPMNDRLTGNGSPLVRDAEGRLLFTRDGAPVMTEHYARRIARFHVNEFLARPEQIEHNTDECRSDLMPALTWVTDEDAEVHEVWLDNLTTGAREVHHPRNLTTASWTPSADLTPGRYRAWVRSAGAGLRSAWSAPYDFTVQYRPPEFLSATGLNDNRLPLFDWDDVPNAVSYDLWVNLRGAVSSPLINVTVASSEYSVTEELNNGNYQIWVRARDAAGPMTAWSAASSYLLRDPAPTGVTRTWDPIRRESVFTWDGGAETDREIWIAGYQTPSVPTIRAIVSSATEFRASLTELPSGPYKVWVRSLDDGGDGSLWSLPVEFGVSPDRPVIVMPTVSNGLRPEIRWSDDSQSAQWQIWISDLRVGTRTHLLTSDTPSLVPIEELSTGRHRIWVRGLDAESQPVTPWSTGHTLTVRLPAPVVIAPPHCTTERLPLIEWEYPLSTPQLRQFHIQILFEDSDDVAVSVMTEDTRTEYALTEALLPGKYRVQVRAYSDTGDFGRWSTAHLFTITD